MRALAEGGHRRDPPARLSPALPPLNGFVSEWLIFQGLFQGFRTGSHLTGILIVLAVGTLGLTGGLAIYAFVRGFGIPYLGIPRTRQAAHDRRATIPTDRLALNTQSVYFITMSDSKQTDPRPDLLSDDALEGYSDGDVIRFEPQELPGKPGAKPLTIHFEIEIATGKRGETVALAQTAAIRNMLDWLASRRPGKGESEPLGTTDVSQ